MGIAAGVLVALVAGAALVWLILHIVNTEHTRSDNQPVPPSFPSATTAASAGTSQGSTSAPPTNTGVSGTVTSSGKPSDTSPTSRPSSQPTRASSSQGAP